MKQRDDAFKAALKELTVSVLRMALYHVEKSLYPERIILSDRPTYGQGFLDGLLAHSRLNDFHGNARNRFVRLP